MKRILTSAAAVVALALASGTAFAQKGEVVYYGYKGGHMLGAKVAFEKLHPDITVKIVAATNAVPANVGRGEVEFGLVEETKSWGLAEEGFPVKVINPEEGAVPSVGGIAILKNSPNPENSHELARV